MRRRRTNKEMAALRECIYEVCSNDHPMTVRQVFYRLVATGAIDKTESEYKSTIIRLLGEMRETGALPWSWIVDNTRWMRKARTFDSAEDALRDTAAFYRRSLWTAGDHYLEVWLEKEALAGVINPVTEQWDVPLMVTRGYPSKSYVYSAAETIASRAAPLGTIYYFGDLDPSGADIPRATEAGLRRYMARLGSSGRLQFIRAAVTREQVIDLDLQTRPTKRTDSRARDFEGESVELDAIPPATLREMVEHCILAHVDEHELHVLKTAEQSERSYLHRLAEIGVGGAS